MAYERKKFIHELFLQENPDIKVSELPESIRQKIDKFNETVPKVYGMTHKLKRNQNIAKLELLSNDIMEEIKDEVAEEEVVEPVVEPIVEPIVEPVAEPKTPAKKKKAGLGWWLLGGLLGVAVGVSIYKDQKSKAQ